MKRLLLWIGKDSILDPFMGSGSTIVAAAQLGLTATGIEMDADHFNTACRRVDDAYRQADLFVAKPAPTTPVQDQLL